MRRSSTWSDARLKPPYGSVQIDALHPLAPYIIFLLNEQAGPPRSLGVPLLSTFTGNFTKWNTTTQGTALKFDRTAGVDLVDLTAYSSLFNIAPPFSVEVWWDGSGTQAGFSGPFSCRIAGQAGFLILNTLNSAANFKCRLVLYTSGGTETGWDASTTLAYPFNGLQSFLWTYDGTTAKLYLNGKDDSATATSNAGWGQTIKIGIGNDTISGNIAKVSIYKRVLTSGEAWELYKTPYAFLRPLVQRRYFVPSGAAAIITTKNLPSLMMTGVGV